MTHLILNLYNKLFEAFFFMSKLYRHSLLLKQFSPRFEVYKPWFFEINTLLPPMYYSFLVLRHLQSWIFNTNLSRYWLNRLLIQYSKRSSSTIIVCMLFLTRNEIDSLLYKKKKKRILQIHKNLFITIYILLKNIFIILM